MSNAFAIDGQAADGRPCIARLEALGAANEEGPVIWGRSPAMAELRQRLEVLAPSPLLVLEPGTVTRLGDSRARPAAPRVVAATNLEVAQLVREGRFRHDLYARLNPATRVRVPSLRERREDLPDLIRFAFADALRSGSLLPLARAWLARSPAADDLDSPTVSHRHCPFAVLLPERALQRLSIHHWPGNHRELKLFAANALVFSLMQPPVRGGRASATLTVSERLVDQLLDVASVPPASPPSATPSG